MLFCQRRLSRVAAAAAAPAAIVGFSSGIVSVVSAIRCAVPESFLGEGGCLGLLAASSSCWAGSGRLHYWIPGPLLWADVTWLLMLYTAADAAAVWAILLTGHVVFTNRFLPQYCSG